MTGSNYDDAVENSKHTLELVVKTVKEIESLLLSNLSLYRDPGRAKQAAEECQKVYAISEQAEKIATHEQAVHQENQKEEIKEIAKVTEYVERIIGSLSKTNTYLKDIESADLKVEQEFDECMEYLNKMGDFAKKDSSLYQRMLEPKTAEDLKLQDIIGELQSEIQKASNRVKKTEQVILAFIADTEHKVTKVNTIYVVIGQHLTNQSKILNESVSESTRQKLSHILTETDNHITRFRQVYDLYKKVYVFSLDLDKIITRKILPKINGFISELNADVDAANKELATQTKRNHKKMQSIHILQMIPQKVEALNKEIEVYTTDWKNRNAGESRDLNARRLVNLIKTTIKRSDDLIKDLRKEVKELKKLAS